MDWEQPRCGNAGQDIGCCRHELTLLAGLEAGDLFLAAYEAQVGPVLNLFFWDLHVAANGALSDLDHWLSGHRDLGRTDLTLDASRAMRASCTSV